MAIADTFTATFADRPATRAAIGNPTDAGRGRMKQSFLGVAVFAATLAVGLSAEGPAPAAPFDPQGAGLTQASFAPYMFGGRQFCWYDSAWSGAGWYWCGYAWRDGFGWGGPRGWNGWHRSGDHRGYGHSGLAGGHFGGGAHMGPGPVGGHLGWAGGGGAHFGAGGGHVGMPDGGGGHFGGAGHVGGGGGHFGGGGGGHGGGGGGGGHGGGGHH